MAKTIENTINEKKIDKATRPTIEMVASLANVSSSTVSRVLNGTAKVSKEKKRAIDKAIEKLGFIPNPMASGLAGGKSRSIGVITQALGSPFYGQGLLGIEEVLIKENYSPLFVSSHWRKRDELRCINTLNQRRVDGIIILTACLSESILIKQAQNIPLVITGRMLDEKKLTSIYFDNFLGAKIATDHLIDLGHRHIAFIQGTSTHQDAIDRYRGYCTSLKNNKIPLDKTLIIQGNFQEQSGEIAINMLLKSKKRFTAIFASNDQMAYGAALALYRNGLTIPDDISLIGFDDLGTSEFLIPPLTTIKHSIYEIGATSAKAIIQLIHGQPPTLSSPAPKLIIRDSTCPPKK